MPSQRIAVIGGVAAGPAAAAQAKRTDPEADVVLFERGEHISYGACEMPYYVGAWIDDVDRLVVLSPAEYERTRGARVRIRHEVRSIGARSGHLHVIRLDTGAASEERFDKIILANGARARIPEIDGIDAENVFPMRRLEDAKALRAYLDSHPVLHAVVLGGGYVGIEMAEVLRSRGIRVSILERSGGLLHAYLDDELRPLVHEEVRRHGIFIRHEEAICLERDAYGRAGVVVTNRGERIGCDLVVIAMGIIPNTKLAEDAGARLGETGALAVDDGMRTSLPKVWACGDLVELRRVVDSKNIYAPLSPAAFRTGRVAGENAARRGRGSPARFPGVTPASAVKVFGLEVAMVGLSLQDAEAAGLRAFASTIRHWSRVPIYPDAKRIHVRLVVEESSGRLLGAEVIGEEGAAQRANVLVPLIRDSWRVDQVRDVDLLYTPPFAPSLDPLIVAANEAAKKLHGI